MTRPPFYFPPEAALPREPAMADQGDGDNDSLYEDCAECDGAGGWTETYERDGREFDVAVDCNECGGSGRR